MNQFFFHPIITSCLQHKAKGIKERKDSNFHHQWHPHGHFKLEYHLLNYFFDPFNSLRLFIKKIISSLTIHIMHSNYIYSIQSLQHRAKKCQSMKKNSLWMIPISNTTSSSKATILIQTLQYNKKKKVANVKKESNFDLHGDYQRDHFKHWSPIHVSTNPNSNNSSPNKPIQCNTPPKKSPNGEKGQRKEETNFDLTEGDQEAHLELGVQPKKAGGIAEVSTGCNQCIHLPILLLVLQIREWWSENDDPMIICIERDRWYL